MGRPHIASMLAGAAMIGLLSGCGGGSPQAAPATEPAIDREAIAAEVKAAIRTQVDAYAAHDPAKAATIMAPDVTGMFHGEANLSGRAAAEAQMKAQMADPAARLAVSDETVDVAQAGDMAVYHATYRFTFTHPETRQPAAETGNWVAIFKRQPDGTMKMSSDMVLDTPPPATVPAA